MFVLTNFFILADSYWLTIPYWNLPILSILHWNIPTILTILHWNIPILNILYSNIPTDWLYRTGIFLLTDYFVLEYSYTDSFVLEYSFLFVLEHSYWLTVSYWNISYWLPLLYWNIQCLCISINNDYFRTLFSIGEWPLHIITVIICNRFTSYTVT